jgi:acetyltransferase-like isoleucine patch superfamily enzyme
VHSPLTDKVRSMGYERTCSIANPVDRAVTFLRDPYNWKAVLSIPRTCEVLALVPDGTPYHQFGKNINWIKVDDPATEFILVHNELNQFRPRKPDQIAGARIHETARIGEHGARFIRLPSGELIRMIHQGNVVIEPGCEIGPYSVIHAGTLDSTVIHEGVQVGSSCTIGHNAEIGKHSLLTVRVSIGGSSKIGARCFLGMGSTVKNQVKICDDTMIGAGGLVVRDIEKPGVYAGFPVKYIGPWNGEW